MHNPQQEPLSFREKAQRGANIIAAFSSGFAAFGEVALFRYDFGSRYFEGFRIAAPLALIPIFSLFFPEPENGVGWLLLLWPFYLLRIIMHRLRMWRRHGSGPLVHSRYNGIPRLARWFKHSDEIKLKTLTEPFVMLMVAIATMTVSIAAAWFFIWTAIGMGVYAGLLNRYDEVRAQDMVDAAIDAELMAERVRTIRGEVAGRHNCWRRT